jgi:hypothetical protein
MRRALFILSLVVLLAVPVVDAAAEGTPGSVSLEFRAGAGVAKVRFRGNFLGRIERGRAIATSNVILSGCAYRKRLADGRNLCRGTNLGFRTPSNAQWRLTLSGRGIDASGFVRGCMTLDGLDTGVTGKYRIKGQPEYWRYAPKWPRSAWTRQLGAGC